MNLSHLAVKRPVFTMMVTMIVIILGAISFVRIPIDLMPDVTNPVLSVSSEYGTASPEEMEDLITRPIEEAMSSVPGAEEVTSVSVEGRSSVRVKFSWGTNLDAAADDMRDRLDRIISHLPEDAERPSVRKFDLASMPILFLGASSKLDPVELRRIIDDEVKYRIERVPGVASLDVWGGQRREIHVNINPAKLKSLGVPLDQIVARLVASNVNVPAGTIDLGNLDMNIRTPGEFKDTAEIKRTVIAVRDGVAVTLGEIADVDDTWQRETRRVRINGEPGVRLAVTKQSGTNTVDVATRALAEVARINDDMREIKLTPIVDTSDFIKRSISNVGGAAVYGGLLAVLVLLFFLRDVRSTTIIATAIPISIIATFTLIYFTGFTLNVMTLGGLALGVGMLVDNSIVVLENISRLREGGCEPYQAAVDGSDEVLAAIVASTLTTVVVFLPLIFMRGMAGVMFKQLALVVSFALLCSMAVAVTIVPMLAARILKTHSKAAEVVRLGFGERLFRLSARAFERVESAYKELLHWSLDHKAAVVIGSLLLVASSLVLTPFIGSELMPATDESAVQVSIETEVGTRLDVIDRISEGIEATVRSKVPEMRCMSASIGGSGFMGGGGNTAEINAALVPISARSRSSDQVSADLRKATSATPGAKVRVTSGQSIMSRVFRMGASSTDQIQIEIRGYDLETADDLAAQVMKILGEVDGVVDPRLSRLSGSPEGLMDIDRRKAADMRLTVQQIADTLQTALSGTLAGYLRDGGKEYNILVQLKEPQKLTVPQVLDLTVTNADGEPVVIRNVAGLVPRSGPVKIERKNQDRILTVSANISGRDMGSVISDIRERLGALAVPQDFSINISGDYEEQQRSFRELSLSLVLALILVYMVMACQYESLRDPFVVMFSVPLAIIGVELMLFLTKTTFNIQSYIGCIMLGGIVVNNAILLVDHTNLLRRRDGMPLREAVEEAGRRRLRPILMTALTTIVGLLPLALGLGEGGEAQAPLARVVIGGLMSATFITLVFVPVIYTLFEKGLRGDAAASHSA